MNQGLSSYHAELLHPAEGYAPFGDAGPVLNADQLHHLQALRATPAPQYGAVTPQAAQLAAALLAQVGKR